MGIYQVCFLDEILPIKDSVRLLGGYLIENLPKIAFCSSRDGGRRDEFMHCFYRRCSKL